MIKVISFDLDGTLVDEKMDSLFWDHEIPKLYAEKHNMSLKQAKKFISNEYYKSDFTQDDPEWYNPKPWFKRFNLDFDYKKIIESLKSEIKIYGDALQILFYLKSKGLRISRKNLFE